MIPFNCERMVEKWHQTHQHIYQLESVFTGYIYRLCDFRISQQRTEIFNFRIQKNSQIFALPRGFLQKNEDLDDAAKRVLNERTGLNNIYLNQFHTFGSLLRNRPSPMKKMLEKNHQDFDENHFLLQRFISISYYALVNFMKVEPEADFLSDSCKWYDSLSTGFNFRSSNHFYQSPGASQK